MRKVSYEKIQSYIVQFMEENGYAPVFREIAKGLGIAPSTAFECLRDMKARNMIDYRDDSPRTITIPGYKFVKVS